jgi:hypothetical protein
LNLTPLIRWNLTPLIRCLVSVLIIGTSHGAKEANIDPISSREKSALWVAKKSVTFTQSPKTACRVDKKNLDSADLQILSAASSKQILGFKSVRAKDQGEKQTFFVLPKVIRKDQPIPMVGVEISYVDGKCDTVKLWSTHGDT